MRQSDLSECTFHEADSEWVRSFSVQDVKCLVVCRGPVRKEAFDVFEASGVREWGMLLSEKDSIVYPRCLAPELRSLRFPANVHRVTDYMGVGQEEKLERIGEIIDIAKANDYTHLFAGYGFMAEDFEFVEAIEAAGLAFIGPSSPVIKKAGAKDEAKKLARSLGNAVIPGVDNISSLALLKRCPDRKALETLAKKQGLASSWDWDEETDAAENAEALLQAGYSKTVELVTIEELQKAAERESEKIWAQYPEKRIRYKAIGGGGGKGQRVVGKIEDTANAVFEILAEQKVTDPGSNRNFLIELNLETTRHNEIQVIGNGDWAMSLGGRDCSIQMYEQKQLEFSLTRELLDEAIPRYEGTRRETLEKDQVTLAAMEQDSERFGEGVGLDSVSTFECIVEGFDHFFMEMNTRIQVEHGVTELAYRLKFTNPDDPNDSFYVDRLIEAMVLLALYGPRLPRPERVARAVSGAEIRVNAMNAALQPHAGGMIRTWSPPLDFEHRDDQGISIRNPDTGSFVYYNLAGAYDSNIALILSDGENRADNLDRLAEILRQMEIRGDDVRTSCQVQYGLINWTIGLEPMMKPNTRFLPSYLAAVGSLQELARDFDLGLAAQESLARMPDRAAKTVYAAKETLLLRPLGRLLADPHALAGFIGLHDDHLWTREGDKVDFAENPVGFLAALYHYLHMEEAVGKPASEMIWQDDAAAIQEALDFYTEVEKRTGVSEWTELQKLFDGAGAEAVAGGDAELWARCQAAHRGFQLGLDLLLVIPRIGIRSGFLDITVDDQLQPVFPDQYLDETIMGPLIKVLNPPPAASSDEIVTPMGGTFFAREAPSLPILADVGTHFDEGQPLFVIEVMKMFNKINAPFAGTVVENLLPDSDGAVVKAGQTIFKIEPDEVVVEESPEDIAERRKMTTLSLLS